MENYQNEVLALQEMESMDQDERIAITTVTTSSKVCISAISGITAASVSAAWNSSLTLGCGK